ncbi:MAG: hypothetical protein ACREMQ_18580 [Longimicrobiales bacterium]
MVALVALAIAFSRADQLLAFVVTQPAAGIVALLLSALLAWREYARGAARVRPFHTAFPLGLSGEGEWWTERLARPGRTRDWSGASPGASRFGWMRAAILENFGRYRFGWTGWTIGLALAAAGFVVFARVPAEDVFSVYAMAMYIHRAVGLGAAAAMGSVAILGSEGSSNRSNVFGYASFFAWFIAFLTLAKVGVWFAAGEMNFPVSVLARTLALPGAALLVRVAYRYAIDHHFRYDDLV